MKARFEFPSHICDPLSITALYGRDGVLRYLLNNADLRSCNYLPISAIAAMDQVSQWGDDVRLRVLLTELSRIAAHAGSRPIVQRLFSVAERHADLASELLREFRMMGGAELGEFHLERPWPHDA
jgi:hypothetical protein